MQALRAQTRALAQALGVVGLINVQFAIRNDTDLRAGGEPARLPHGAVRLQGDRRAAGQDRDARHARRDRSTPLARVGGRELPHIAVKESVFPFIKFPGVDTVLGPEMKSTGEVMGIDRDFRKAYLKSQIAAGSALPTSGKVFVSVQNRDKRAVAPLARRLVEMGFTLVATPGTARVLGALRDDGRD